MLQIRLASGLPVSLPASNSNGRVNTEVVVIDSRRFAAALKMRGVDSTPMTLRIEQAKGRKDRCAIQSPLMLERLFCSAAPLLPVSPGYVSAAGRTRC